MFVSLLVLDLLLTSTNIGHGSPKVLLASFGGRWGNGWCGGRTRLGILRIRGSERRLGHGPSLIEGHERLWDDAAAQPEKRDAIPAEIEGGFKIMTPQGHPPGA